MIRDFKWNNGDFHWKPNALMSTDMKNKTSLPSSEMFIEFKFADCYRTAVELPVSVQTLSLRDTKLFHSKEKLSNILKWETNAGMLIMDVQIAKRSMIGSMVKGVNNDLVQNTPPQINR